MAIQFPINPVDGQLFVSGNKTYIWIASKQYWRCRATVLQTFGTPNTLAAYGITDTYTKTEVDTLISTLTGLQNIGEIGIGSQGLMGIQGLQGIIGIQGITGIQGVTGAGIQGIQGLSGSGGGSSITWLVYVLNWTVEPVFVSSISQGDVYHYYYNGSDAYRLVPTDGISVDSFYAIFSNSTLSTLLAQRGNL